MSVQILENYAAGKWTPGKDNLRDIASAVTGETIAASSAAGLDFKAMLDHARNVGGPALRKLTFHDRAYILKDLAKAIMEKKEELYALNFHTGATRKDGYGS